MSTWAQAKRKTQSSKPMAFRWADARCGSMKPKNARRVPAAAVPAVAAADTVAAVVVADTAAVVAETVAAVAAVRAAGKALG